MSAGLTVSYRFLHIFYGSIDPITCVYVANKRFTPRLARKEKYMKISRLVHQLESLE